MKISIKILLKCVPQGPINNISVLVQIVAWCQIGDKPLSEPKVTQFNDIYVSPGLNDLIVKKCDKYQQVTK